MKTTFVFLCTLIAFSVQAQFNVENYFTGSVSFSFEDCSLKTVKKKEVKSCKTYKYIARINGEQFRLTEIQVWPNGQIMNTNMASYVEGNLSSISFIQSTIEKMQPVSGYTINPADIYYLKLRVKDGKPLFKDVTEFFATTGTSSVSMYFPSYAAAEQAKTLLQNIADINSRAANGPNLVLQDIPVSKCSDKASRFVNKNYGYTLCLEQNETANEKTYSKYNHTYLKDFTTVSGYSDLPFYIFSIDFKNEPDSILVFNKTEQEFFDKLGAATILKKEIYMDKYTKASSPGEHNSYFRGYDVTLASGAEAIICFDYLLDGNRKFDALCFAYMAPTGLEGAGYSFRNLALMEECVVLTFK